MGSQNTWKYPACFTSTSFKILTGSFTSVKQTASNGDSISITIPHTPSPAQQNAFAGRGIWFTPKFNRIVHLRLHVKRHSNQAKDVRG